MKDKYYVTITGINHYYGKKPFEIGSVIQIIKEPDNIYDKEAIYAYMPVLEKIGYVANSTYTVADGTMSAGRLYDKIGKTAKVKVLFISGNSVIAKLITKKTKKDSFKSMKNRHK
jgi:hypothetical protein